MRAFRFINFIECCNQGEAKKAILVLDLWCYQDWQVLTSLIILELSQGQWHVLNPKNIPKSCDCKGTGGKTWTAWIRLVTDHFQ